MNEIDSLTIKIVSEASQVDKPIKKLTESLSALSNSLARLNTGNLNNLSVGMSTLSKAMDGFKQGNISAKTFSSIATGIKKFEDIDSAKLQALSAGLNPVATSMQTLMNALSVVPNISRQVTGLINSIARLGNAGSNSNASFSALPILEANLRSLMNTLARAPAVSQSTVAITQGVAQLASAGQRAGETATNLSALGNEMLKVIQTLSTAPNVSKNVVNLVSALAKLAKTGSSAGRATTALSKAFASAGSFSEKFRANILGISSGMNIFSKSSRNALLGLRSFTRQLLSSLGIVGGLYMVFNGIKKAIDISSDLREVQNVVDVTFGQMAYKVEDFAKTSIQQFGMSELTLKRVASRFQAMGTAMNINPADIQSANEFLNKQTNGYIGLSDSMADVSLNLTKLTADMASFYNVEQTDVAQDLEAIFTGQTRPLILAA